MKNKQPSMHAFFGVGNKPEGQSAPPATRENAQPLNQVAAGSPLKRPRSPDIGKGVDKVAEAKAPGPKLKRFRRRDGQSMLLNDGGLACSAGELEDSDDDGPPNAEDSPGSLQGVSKEPAADAGDSDLGAAPSNDLVAEAAALAAGQAGEQAKTKSNASTKIDTKKPPAPKAEPAKTASKAKATAGGEAAAAEADGGGGVLADAPHDVAHPDAGPATASNGFHSPERAVSNGDKVEEVDAFKKAFKQAPKAGKATKGDASRRDEGVGHGAVAAAALHSKFDLDMLLAVSPWAPGEPVPYAFLVATFEDISVETKRLLIISMLTNAFRAIIATTPDDLLPAVYLCVSRVAPSHESIELGVGDAILIRALAQATGRQESQLKKEYEAEGDLGVVATNSKSKQRTMFQPKPLTIRGVFQQLKAITAIEGNKSQDVKKGMIMKLLAAAKGGEPGFVMRLLQGKLRIRLAEQSVLVALAQAVCLQRMEGQKHGGEELANLLGAATKAVRCAYCECPSYDVLVPTLLQHGTDDLLAHVHFVPGMPIKAMLAKPTNGVSEVLDKFSDCEFTCEYKYDGERAQVHVLDSGKVQIYSRNLENTTAKYPDIVERMAAALAPGVKSVVLDCEIQAWDVEKKVFLPFQVLTTRKRKDVKSADIKVQVVLFCFDCLYLDGEVTMRQPLSQRRQAMYRAIVPQEGSIQFATAKTSRDVDELQTFLDEAVAACTEGLIVKTLADTYEPSKRSLNWLKLKKDYLDGQGDTFDVTVVGALHGKGKRTGGYGSFLLAIWDPENEEYQTISKIGTGFSEELLKEVSEQLKEHVISKAPRYYRVTDKLVPDVWLEPRIVWEVKAADLSISPVYTAAIGRVDAQKGISIRFPRLVRARDDKGPEDTTSPEQIAEMYSRQAVVNSSSKAHVDEDLW